jgi:hypothetical protein
MAGILQPKRWSVGVSRGRRWAWLTSEVQLALFDGVQRRRRLREELWSELHGGNGVRGVREAGCVVVDANEPTLNVGSGSIHVVYSGRCIQASSRCKASLLTSTTAAASSLVLYHGLQHLAQELHPVSACGMRHLHCHLHSTALDTRKGTRRTRLPLPTRACRPFPSAETRATSY